MLNLGLILPTQILVILHLSCILMSAASTDEAWSLRDVTQQRSIAGSWRLFSTWWLRDSGSLPLKMLPSWQSWLTHWTRVRGKSLLAVLTQSWHGPLVITSHVVQPKCKMVWEVQRGCGNHQEALPVLQMDGLGASSLHWKEVAKEKMNGRSLFKDAYVAESSQLLQSKARTSRELP